jgi:Tfp pilus assembly protein FimT
MRFLQKGVVIVLASLLPSLAAASMVQVLDLAQMTNQADRIVLAQVVSTKSAWDAQRRFIHTTVELEVEEVWKGTSAQHEIIVQPGGTVGDMEMRVHGMPQFTAGEKTLLFLAGQDAPRVVGMSQGKRSVHWTGKQWMAEMAEHSALVRRDAQGRFQPATPEPAMGLDELRQRVRALIRH